MSLRREGMRLRLLGVGAYREAYRIVNADVVIKFPRSKTTNEGRKHSQQEMARIKQLKENTCLAEFLPEVLYYDKSTGVIAMRHYSEFKGFEEQADAMGRMIQKMMTRLSGVQCTDVHTENVRRGRGRQDCILIDLGF